MRWQLATASLPAVTLALIEVPPSTSGRVAVILKLSIPHDILADSTYRRLKPENLSYNYDEQICCRFAAN